MYNKILRSVENDKKTCNSKKISKASVHRTNITKKANSIRSCERTERTRGNGIRLVKKVS